MAQFWRPRRLYLCRFEASFWVADVTNRDIVLKSLSYYRPKGNIRRPKKRGKSAEYDVDLTFP